MFPLILEIEEEFVYWEGNTTLLQLSDHHNLQLLRKVLWDVVEIQVLIEGHYTEVGSLRTGHVVDQALQGGDHLVEDAIDDVHGGQLNANHDVVLTEWLVQILLRCHELIAPLYKLWSLKAIFSLARLVKGTEVFIGDFT